MNTSSCLSVSEKPGNEAIYRSSLVPSPSTSPARAWSENESRAGQKVCCYAFPWTFSTEAVSSRSVSRRLIIKSTLPESTGPGLRSSRILIARERRTVDWVSIKYHSLYFTWLNVTDCLHDIVLVPSPGIICMVSLIPSTDLDHLQYHFHRVNEFLNQVTQGLFISLSL